MERISNKDNEYSTLRYLEPKREETQLSQYYKQSPRKFSVLLGLILSAVGGIYRRNSAVKSFPDRQIRHTDRDQT